MKTLFPLVVLLAGIASASAQNFLVSLDAAQEVGGPAGGTGSGMGTITLSGTSLTFNNILYSGLSGTVTAAHIHGAAPPGVNAGVLYFLTPTFTATGGTSGSINGTLTLMDGMGGFTIAQQLTQLNSGLWYINIHTSPTFSGGEIRGQIIPVPEPATWALGGLGLLGLLAWGRRK